MSNSIHLLCHLRPFTINTPALWLEAADCIGKRAAIREFRDNSGNPSFLHSHCSTREEMAGAPLHHCKHSKPERLRGERRALSELSTTTESLDFLLINHRPLLWLFPRIKFL